MKYFSLRSKKQASYSFYVWENGGYVHADGGEFESDVEASAAARMARRTSEIMERPVSLDSPHLHVVRDDGIHILTLELAD